MSLQTLSEKEIISTLIALSLLLLSAYSIGTLMEKIKAPRVGGEITGGILLGGTCLYYFFPDFISSIFMAYSPSRSRPDQMMRLYFRPGIRSFSMDRVIMG